MHNRLKSKVRRVLLGTVLALSAAVGTLGIDASSAQAGWAGEVVRNVICRTQYYGPGTIQVMPQVAVQPGYVNGQWITYQYYVSGSNGSSGYSGWAAPKFVPYNGYQSTYLAASTMSGAHGVNWSVQVRIGYWNGSSYEYGAWGHPSAYDHGNSAGRIFANCTT